MTELAGLTDPDVGWDGWGRPIVGATIQAAGQPPPPPNVGPQGGAAANLTPGGGGPGGVPFQPTATRDMAMTSAPRGTSQSMTETGTGTGRPDQ